MNYKVKIIVGFRKDQEYTIDAEEAHKAYYLFTHPNERGVFSNGLALIGSHIQSIVPDWHATMGWNSSHVLNDDDWNQLRLEGVLFQLPRQLEAAKNIGVLGDPSDANKPLSTLLKEKYPQLAERNTQRSGKVSSAKELLAKR